MIGLFAWIGYGTLAMRGMNATISRDPMLARRMASYADAFSLAQLLLGMLAVALGWVAGARSGGPRLAQGFGASALSLGVVVLLLLLLFV